MYCFGFNYNQVSSCNSGFEYKIDHSSGVTTGNVGNELTSTRPKSHIFGERLKPSFVHKGQEIFKESDIDDTHRKNRNFESGKPRSLIELDNLPSGNHLEPKRALDHLNLTNDNEISLK